MVTETQMYFGMMVENRRTHSRFYAAIPGTKETEISITENEERRFTTYKHMNIEQAKLYVLSEEFLNREDNEYWKEAVEKWGADNFRFHYYPDCYDSEDEFFERYANPIIDRMHTNTDLCCYNIEPDSLESVLVWDEVGDERKHTNQKGRTSSEIVIRNIATGEVKCFASKGECMSFLGCREGAFSRFLKGKSRLNKNFETVNC